MAFGQQSGPPASARQVQQLLDLVRAAGHEDFRDARGAMGLTQRQAAGKFTRDEAAELIDRLEEAESTGDAPAPTRPSTAAARPSAVEQALGRATPEQLAAELQRRGWIVVEP